MSWWTLSSAQWCRKKIDLTWNCSLWGLWIILSNQVMISKIISEMYFWGALGILSQIACSLIKSKRRQLSILLIPQKLCTSHRLQVRGKTRIFVWCWTVSSCCACSRFDSCDSCTLNCVALCQMMNLGSDLTFRLYLIMKVMKQLQCLR